ncbi:MAG TPA: group II intron reverse transcriptase/maturase [Polyangiales bacterium]
MSLQNPAVNVQKLQTALHAKAKAEPDYRFYSLWDKVCRDDVLREAWRRCRKNGGVAGTDGLGFADIEAGGLERWLGTLQQEMRAKMYRPRPLLRVWIPKSSGGERPLGIPTIRDRVVQAAAVIVLTPIFEADLLDEQYGFRPERDAKMALREVVYQLQRCKRTEVVDADLSDYFNTIPHGALMKSVARRVADGQILSVIKQWLATPVVERIGGATRQTNEARRTHRGTPQGGVISPLLANLYFRRFLLGWKRQRAHVRDVSAVVNYADDFVICCAPGNGTAALAATRELMSRLGLQVNDNKTRLVRLPEEQFDFLGYTVGRFYSKDGKPYLGTAPSKKALGKAMRRIHDETSRRWLTKTIESRIAEINRFLRGWCGYFNQGPVRKPYEKLAWYTQRRLQRWLARKHKKPGSGYRQYPHDLLYGKLGLYRPTVPARSLPRAKA